MHQNSGLTGVNPPALCSLGPPVKSPVYFILAVSGFSDKVRFDPCGYRCASPPPLLLCVCPLRLSSPLCLCLALETVGPHRSLFHEPTRSRSGFGQDIGPGFSGLELGMQLTLLCP